MNDNVQPATPIARVVLASFIGTSIEWYDFFLYGTAAALVFSKLFFPTLDPLAGTMASFATYAVGFFARPLGGIVFGHYGDRIDPRDVRKNDTRVLLMSKDAAYGRSNVGRRQAGSCHLVEQRLE